MVSKTRNERPDIQSFFTIHRCYIVDKMVQNFSTFEILYKNGYTTAEMLIKAIKCSRATAFRVLKLLREGKSLEDRPRTGRPPKMSSEDIRVAKCIASKRTSISINKLAVELRERRQTIVHPSTVYRNLVKHGYEKRKPLIVPIMSEKTRQNRVEWCKRHLDFDWSKVFFSDESTFETFRFKDKEWTKAGTNIYRPRPKYPTKIMIWGAISSRGKSILKVVKGSIDRFAYVSILEEALIETANTLYPDHWTLQQDNAPPHTAKSTKNWFRRNDIKVLDWPPNSPDLNPIETLWAIMKKRLGNEIITKTDDIVARVSQIWDEISNETVTSLIESMQWRVRACIALNGATVNPNEVSHSLE